MPVPHRHGNRHGIPNRKPVGITDRERITNGKTKRKPNSQRITDRDSNDKCIAHRETDNERITDHGSDGKRVTHSSRALALPNPHARRIPAACGLRDDTGSL